MTTKFKGVHVISSAGATNPLVCAAALDKMTRKAGIDLNVAVVTGDDIMGEKEALQRSAITDLESGKKFPDTMRSMNVYLGHNIGFPILECFPDGQFILSKPPGMGGLVFFGTVADQLLYEISDPKRSLLPDVTCRISITEIPGSSRSSLLTFSTSCREESSGNFFKRNCPSSDCNGSPVLKRLFFLYLKQKVKVDIHLINGAHNETFHEDLTFTLDTLASPNLPKTDDDVKDLPGGSLTYRLEDLAYTRSGDKGSSANIGIIAWHPLYYPYLKKFLIAQAIEDFIQHILHKEQPEGNFMIRCELPGIYALNFVLKNSLGGGGMASLRSDPQGELSTWTNGAGLPDKRCS